MSFMDDRFNVNREGILGTHDSNHHASGAKPSASNLWRLCGQALFKALAALLLLLISEVLDVRTDRDHLS